MIIDRGKTLDGNNYVEDSTRGNAILNPKKTKGDLMVQVWLPRTELAALAVWLSDNGENPRFMSEVVRKVLHMVYDNLITNDEIQPLTDPVLATDILSSKFGISTDVKRGKRNLLHNKILYDRMVSSGMIKKDIEKEDLLMREIRKGLYGEDKQTLEQFRSEAKKNVKVDENGLVINETQPQKPVIPEWAGESSNNKQPGEYEEKYNPDDRFTMRKMTEDELIEKERLRNERDQRERELMDQMARDMRKIDSKAQLIFNRT